MDYQYKQTILNNGLRVITAFSAISNASSVEMWIRAGSKHEGPKECGHAHILEHMLLKGTKDHPSEKELKQEINDLGAQSNAVTSREYTRFYFKIVNDNIERLFPVLSEMILESLINDSVLEKEKKIIIEELNNFSDNPKTFLATRALEDFFGNHPLGNHPIGKKHIIEKTSPGSLRKFLNKNYSPKNSAIIVSGGIPHKQAVQLAEKYFGKWKVNNKHNFKHKKVKKTENNIFFIKKDTNKYFFYINYLTPGSKDLNSKELTALSVLSQFLAGNSTSYLRSSLRGESALVYDLVSANKPNIDAGRIFIATSTTKPRHFFKSFNKLMRDLDSNFTPKDLKEIKTSMKNEFILSMANPLDVARFMGNKYVLFGDIFTPEEYLKDLEGADFNLVKLFIDKYIKKENRHMSVLGPASVNF